MAIFEIALRGPNEQARVGVQISIQVEVRNVSQQPAWIVGVIDGSEEGIRYPHYLPEVWRAGQMVADLPVPEDPLVGPLRMEDFRLLAPGETFDPTVRSGGAAYLPISTFRNFFPLKAGVYQFSLTLSTESQSTEQWLGRFRQDIDRAAVLERIALIPRQTVRSNVLEVEVA